MAKFNVGTIEEEKVGTKETIISRMAQGKVLPIISNTLSNQLVFGSHEDIVESWAEYISYPFPDKLNLTRMTQYRSVLYKADPELKADDVYIKERYLEFLSRVIRQLADKELLKALDKETSAERLSFSRIAERLELPDLTGGSENPLLLLAELPVPIYLTTSYHNFLEVALRRAGKEPRVEICYWDRRLRSIPSIFEKDPAFSPTPTEPLIYHLHGLDAYPSSLVITEDDHLDFMVNISMDREGLPLPVRRALADYSLVMLGYGLRDWDFRVLFRGLIMTSNDRRRPVSVSIQIIGDDEEKNYLQNYLNQEGEFDVYWQDPVAFLKDIWQGLNE